MSFIREQICRCGFWYVTADQCYEGSSCSYLQLEMVWYLDLTQAISPAGSRFTFHSEAQSVLIAIAVALPLPQEHRLKDVIHIE